MACDVEKVGHLVQREAQPLGRFDDPKDGHCLGRIQPVSPDAAIRLAQQTPPFVVAQRLQVDSGGVGDLAAAQAHRHAVARPMAAHSASASSTCTWAGGTVTCTRTASSATLMLKAKK